MKLFNQKFETKPQTTVKKEKPKPQFEEVVPIKESSSNKVETTKTLFKTQSIKMDYQDPKVPLRIKSSHKIQEEFKKMTKKAMKKRKKPKKVKRK